MRSAIRSSDKIRFTSRSIRVVFPYRSRSTSSGRMLKQQAWDSSFVCLVSLVCLVFLVCLVTRETGQTGRQPERRFTSRSRGCSNSPSSSLVVCLVHLVYLVCASQPNKRNRPNKPEQRSGSHLSRLTSSYCQFAAMMPWNCACCCTVPLPSIAPSQLRPVVVVN